MPTTQQLRRDQNAGAVIRVADPDSEYLGKQVDYDPQGPRDLTPWRRLMGEARFTAAQCRAEGLHGGPWAVARRIRF